MIYGRGDLERNRFFADRLVSCGRDLGMDARIVLADDPPPGTPDCAVNRSRDFRVALRLEMRGCVVSNGSEVSRVCNDKWETYRLADSLRIPHMDTSLAGRRLPPGPPWVVKPRSGHGGSGVTLVEDADDLGSTLRSVRSPIVQSMAEPGRDMRAYVLGDSIVACMMRRSDGLRANVSLGARVEPCEPPGPARRVVADVCRALRPDLVGVDFVFRDGEPVLNEMEDAVGCRMLYQHTGLDPARLLMERLHSKMSL